MSIIYLQRPASMKSIFIGVNIVIMVTCAILTAYQCTLCLIQFFSLQTRAIISIQPTGDAKFLAFTICPRFEEAYNLTAVKNLGVTVDAYRQGKFYGNTSSNITEDGFKIFKQVSFELSEIMTSLTITTSDTNNATFVISFDKPLDANIAKWSVIPSYNYGRCFSMQLADGLIEKTILSIDFVAKMGLHLYPHYPGQNLNVDSKTKAYALLGRSITMDVTHELTVNTLEDKGGFPCNSSIDLIFDECINNGLFNHIMTEFGCTVPYVPDLPGGIVCRIDYSNKDDLAKLKNIADQYSFLALSGQKMMCPAPCSSFDVFFGLPFDGVYSSKAARLVLNFHSTMKTRKMVLDYTIVELWADIGGYTGLLLGTSVVHLLKSIDWISFWVIMPDGTPDCNKFLKYILAPKKR